MQAFKQRIYNYYAAHGRKFPWRETHNPYHIFISEVMLQQTQTDRVIAKYEAWIKEFPTFESLAKATSADVLRQWQGLGYNRRGLYVHKSAQRIIAEHAGVLPNDPEYLVTLPGIGKATAASICAFAFNRPTIFIETNIRAVFIHEFFKDATEVTDGQLIPLIEQSVDSDNARIWYYALMDYGVMLKKTFKNPSRKSAHYSVQSKFEGSNRQIRGMILKILTQQTLLTYDDLLFLIPRNPERVLHNLEALCREGFVCIKKEKFYSLHYD